MFSLELSLPHFPWTLYLINIWLLIVAKTTHWMKAWHRGTAGEHVPVPVPSSCPVLPAHCAGPWMEEEPPLEMPSWLQTTLAWCLVLVEKPAPGGHSLQQPGCGYRGVVLPRLPQPRSGAARKTTTCMVWLHHPFPLLVHKVRRYVGPVSGEGL